MQTYLLILLGAVLYACNGKQKKFVADSGVLVKKATAVTLKADTLAYQYRKINEKGKDCKGANCHYYSVSYPYFPDAPQLNVLIRSKLLDQIGLRDSSKGNLDSLIRLSAKDFTEPRDVDSTLSESFNDITFGVAVLNQRNGLVVLVLYSDTYYAGAAHPNTNSQCINWDVKTNSVIELNDILKPGSRQLLVEVAEKIFRKNAGLSGTAPLTNYDFEDGKFALTSNFQIAPKGLAFHYNRYEIQSYADGVTEFTVPYNQIKHLLKPNTVVAQNIE